MSFKMNNCCPSSPCRPEPCGCKFFVDSKCVIYDGRGFRAINLPKGSRAEHIFEWIDDLLYKILNDTLPFRNIGDGAKVYKSRTTDGYYEFRTIKSADEETLVIKEEPTQITIQGAKPTLERRGDVVTLYLTTDKGKVVASTIDLQDYAQASQDIHVSDVKLEGSNLVFSYNKVKAPLSVNVASFLADFYGTELKIQGTTLTLIRNGGLPTLSVDLASLKDNIDTYTTNLQLDNKTIVLSQNGKSDIRLDLTPIAGGGAVTDTFVEGFELDGNTLKLKQNNGKSDLTVDLTKYVFTADKHLTGVEFDNNTFVLTLKRSQGLPDLSVNLAAFKPTQANLTQTDSTKPDFIKNRNLYKEIAADYTLTPADNNTELFINNGGNPLTITIPAKATLTSGLEANNAYFVSFTQIGSGDVTFNGHDVVPSGYKNVIQGQGHVAAVTVTPSTAVLQGNLKQA